MKQKVGLGGHLNPFFVLKTHLAEMGWKTQNDKHSIFKYILVK
jgi:hypothetical protein